ncbi:MAG: 5-(carboxyamino)imidazole ribonucleotide mutase [Acidobacteria bacterium]|nr:5-(carboxyamino)imidazole ribonucleotide mutase [Acidobacteriota bacterium]
MRPEVMILLGSAGDWPVLRETAAGLARLGIGWEAHVASAHRTPERVRELVAGAVAGGIKVFICGAGMAAHLAGVVAAHTVRPVIGVPLAGGIADGLDALLSTVQMPAGIPVATVAVGTAGARNAALLAAQILALGDSALGGRLLAARVTLGDGVAAADAGLILGEGGS